MSSTGTLRGYVGVSVGQKEWLAFASIFVKVYVGAVFHFSAVHLQQLPGREFDRLPNTRNSSLLDPLLSAQMGCWH